MIYDIHSENIVEIEKVLHREDGSESGNGHSADDLEILEILQRDLEALYVCREKLLHLAGLNAVESFETIHNYVDVKHSIVRKGAVAAYEGQKLLIPLNMKDGSLICIGKGNSAWNCSAPHGAGRKMSRGMAKKTVSLEAFKEAMKGIYSTSVCEATLDESPFAYKDANSIIHQIDGETVDVIAHIHPVWNIKAH